MQAELRFLFQSDGLALLCLLLKQSEGQSVELREGAAWARALSKYRREIFTVRPGLLTSG